MIGWSWNVNKQEIENYNINVLYLAVVYAFGTEIIEKNVINLEEIVKIKEIYKDEEFLKLIKEATVIIYVKENLNEKKKLMNLQKNIKEEYTKISNKKEYIQNLTDRKKEILKEIREIDKYINDDLKLKKEYIRQNEILSQEDRVFSLSDFSDKVLRKRKNLEHELKTCSLKLEPKNYVEMKTDIENKLNFIEELKLEDETDQPLNNIICEILKKLYKILETQIKKVETKKEIIDMLYKIKYLKLLPVSDEKNAYDMTEKEFRKLEKTLITKACNLKAMTIFSNNISENYKIIKNVLDTNIIDLDKTFIELKETDNKLKIIVYDENSIEKEKMIELSNDIAIKYNKKMQLCI